MTTYQVEANYPSKFYFENDSSMLEAKLEKQAVWYGGKEYGSGMGMWRGARRDLSYGGFPTREKAAAFISYLKKYKNPKFRAKIVKEE